MIPRSLIEFLSRASVAVASTRDQELTPYLHFLSGWSVGDDLATVECLVAESFADGMIERLKRHPDLALVAEVIGPHETYQFKGRYSSHRAAGPSDQPVFEACRQRFVSTVQAHLKGRFTDETLLVRFREPALAVRFEVGEIFLQTPGPMAGRRVHPAA